MGLIRRKIIQSFDFHIVLHSIPPVLDTHAGGLTWAKRRLRVMMYVSFSFMNRSLTYSASRLFVFCPNIRLHQAVERHISQFSLNRFNESGALHTSWPWLPLMSWKWQELILWNETFQPACHDSPQDGRVGADMVAPNVACRNGNRCLGHTSGMGWLQ